MAEVRIEDVERAFDEPDTPEDLIGSVTTLDEPVWQTIVRIYWVSWGILSNLYTVEGY